MLNWSAMREEHKLIHKAAVRAIEALNDRPEGRGMWDIQTIHMDLEACHCNGCTLDLAKLAEAPLADLLHDVAGINRHLDRETGKLSGCFLPRCAGN